MIMLIDENRKYKLPRATRTWRQCSGYVTIELGNLTSAKITYLEYYSQFKQSWIEKILTRVCIISTDSKFVSFPIASGQNIMKTNAFSSKQKQVSRCSKGDHGQQVPAPQSSHNIKRTSSTTFLPFPITRMPGTAPSALDKCNKKISMRPRQLDRGQSRVASRQPGNGTALFFSAPTLCVPTLGSLHGPTLYLCRCWAAGLPWWSARCARSSRGPHSGMRRARARSKFASLAMPKYLSVVAHG